MRTIGSALVGAAALLVVSAPGHAQQRQDPIAEAATKFYSACIANIGGTPAECGCATGFFAARTKEDEFRMLATVVPLMDSNGEIKDEDAVLNTLASERARIGMSDQRFIEVMNVFMKMDVLGQEADRYCAPVGLKSQGK